MPTFILAGYQRSLHNQIKKAVDEGKNRLNGWTCVLVPGEQHKVPMVTETTAKILLQRAAEIGGAHIFGVSQRNNEVAYGLIRRYFRLRRVGASEVGETGQGRSEPLIAALAAATLEEDYWIANVKPDRPSSPLVLPERVFNAKGELMEMWRLSESFNNQGHLQEASNRIGRFAKEHRRKVDGFVKTPWMDAKSWIWDDSGERHGKPDFPEDWKYSFRLPDGFHFDVSRQKDAKAAFKDDYGYTHPLPKGYLNVTAHGKVRGARPASSISA